ncbi:MAG TPA: HIT domain-containing protein [Myxococcota bacterium]|jgi:ATP adenylyltransferase|nr:HIT domain-containing protein [Myxococcota bacterium]
MKHLFAPWRMAYIKGPDAPACIFCDLPTRGPDDTTLVLHKGARAFIVLNRYPYVSGHLMVVPYRHVASPVELAADEWAEMDALVARSLRALQAEYAPQGFNIGMNVGRAAGAGIADHVHMHVVPRWQGDNNFVSVLSQTRVIPEDPVVTYRRLSAALRAVPQQEVDR